ncbi:pantetheine-phosphate adenylyltransferase [Rhodoferax aquaticus]|uniref:Phosphopantetheine adenylyltransferase n=1 Tax=Rhodoferax aquaticus TaxID=2527691 RepID=A0A515ELK2_9BURK|nr:pantetheine-phosphate adenylyltransferase [Rhodoferax aquaticus]QDL53550.1 pantetheine-phosphate adenylyltransferase [Rhodoferax aquaticus]
MEQAHTVAVYPGTFDPLTVGHLDLIQRAAVLFGTVIVAVATAHHKKTLFSFDERIALVTQELAPFRNVRVHGFSGLVVEFASQHKASAMVRGIRSVTDYDYEAQLAGMNRTLCSAVDTVYLSADARYQAISSTLVREIAALGGNVGDFVTPSIHQALLQKFPKAPSQSTRSS